MVKQLILLISLFMFTTAYAVVEVSASYYYTRQDYPNANSELEDVSVTRTYSGSIAWYMFSTTALEVFYSATEDITIDNNVSLEDTTNSKVINSIRTTLITNSLGVGLRQALAPRTARILPTISIGSSSQVQQTLYKYTYTDSSFGEIETGEIESSVSYATLALRIKITELLGLRAQVTGTYETLDFSKDPAQVSYSAGLSWIF